MSKNYAIFLGVEDAVNLVMRLEIFIQKTCEDNNVSATEIISFMRTLLTTPLDADDAYSWFKELGYSIESFVNANESSVEEGVFLKCLEFLNFFNYESIHGSDS